MWLVGWNNNILFKDLKSSYVLINAILAFCKLHLEMYLFFFFKVIAVMDNQ